MSLLGGIISYLMIWWVVLLCVLPYGITSQTQSGNIVIGSEAGAPSNFKLKPKLLWTSIITFLIWLIVWLVIYSGFFNYLDSVIFR